MLRRLISVVSSWFALIGVAFTLTACGGKGAPAVGPAGLSVVAGDTRATVSWTAETGVEYWLFYAEGAGVTPANWNDGTRNGKAVAVVTSPYTVSGLTNGKLYSFTVNARRDGGPGGVGATAVQATPRLSGVAWTAGTALGTARINRAAAAGFGTIALLAAAEDGKIYSSDNGSVWTPRASNTTNPLYGVTTNGTTSFAVGAGGTIVRGTAVDTWAAVTSGVTTDLLGVASGTNGNTVAVGKGGVVLQTVDGAAWTARASGVALDLLDVSWTNVQFLAVGLGGTVIQSVDTQTWTNKTVPNAKALRGVTYGAGLYAVVGDDGAIYTSPDLTTWTARTSGVNVQLNGVAFGSQFVAIGNGGTILNSTDGITWTKVGSGTSQNLTAITARAGGYVVLGDNGVNLSSF